MAGNAEGGKKAAQKNLERDPEFYAKIGAKGGSKKNELKGFGSATPEQRSEWGKKGGAKSKRTSNKNEEG